ncbi:hypothetical protein AS590_23225 [Prescottella equi]|uniref:hypothetical protein n=1 Tax=Rhodococcus TaxID=1827 RepID=UPI0007DB4F8B|nr:MULTISPECIES: hypothetical protein [Rhodococcus]OCC20869.1 hypothetical protein AS590_23225 [Prescottella equi]AUS33360.1 hypothetical protein C1M55_21215 [Rhodococcus qingshengii]MBP2524238.1 hypothetical protein [Rhodococcus sp. PvP104]MCC4305768.1 hypothetical protein [Rhodococcus sp. 3-2]MDA3637478.1 hypothetical protein [Rhodococcus sp. C-2]
MLLELLSPERISAFGIAATSILAAWVSRQQSQVRQLQAKVAELEGGRKEDRRLIRVCVRFVRAQGNYIVILAALLRQHAPHVEIPPEPTMPDEVKEEV